MEDWDGVAEAYTKSFGQLCAGTVDVLLNDVDHGPMLDVGCGDGRLLIEASRRGISAVGVEPSPNLAALARGRAACEVVEASLPALPFADGTFAFTSTNFVVNHMADPRRAVRELARVTAKGGRVATTIWPAGGAGWAPLVQETFAAARVVPIESTRLPERLDFERTSEGLAALFEEAGLHIIKAHEVRWTWRVRPDALWAGIEGGVATPGQTYFAQTLEVQRAAKQGFFNRAGEMAVGGYLELPSVAAYAVGEVGAV